MDDELNFISLSSKKIKKEEFENSLLLKRLLNLDQIPEEIYIKGSLPEFTEDEYGRLSPRILAVVGSRKYSTYGKDVVNKLISELKGQNIIILSGLALGIDSLAHKAALQNNLPTIVVPGSGLSKNVLYPRSNLPLAREILTNNGLFISELTDETPAASWTFPARNRIMAALSDAILIIEAEGSSGTLITGRLGLELGKDIGVVPGSIFSPTSLGTNELLKSGATPITSGKDLYDLLSLSFEKMSPEAKENILNESERKIFELLVEPRGKDELFQLSELNPNEFMMTITSLEINGIICESFGELRRVV